MTRLVFLHGLEGGPNGSKFQALRKEYPHVEAPDCTGILDPEVRYAKILAHLGSEPALIVGSSFGGLMALLLVDRRPDLVLGALLCAPALHWPEAGGLTWPERIPATILHGQEDVVVPFQCSSDFAARHPGIRLVRVADGHRLSLSTKMTVDLTVEIYASIAA